MKIRNRKSLVALGRIFNFHDDHFVANLYFDLMINAEVHIAGDISPFDAYLCTGKRCSLCAQKCKRTKVMLLPTWLPDDCPNGKWVIIETSRELNDAHREVLKAVSLCMQDFGAVLISSSHGYEVVLAANFMPSLLEVPEREYLGAVLRLNRNFYDEWLVRIDLRTESIRKFAGELANPKSSHLLNRSPIRTSKIDAFLYSWLGLTARPANERVRIDLR